MQFAQYTYCFIYYNKSHSTAVLAPMVLLRYYYLVVYSTNYEAGIILLG